MAVPDLRPVFTLAPAGPAGGKSGDVSVAPLVPATRDGSGDVELRAADHLSLWDALPLCRAVRHHLAAGVRRLVLDLRAVQTADVVGLAALLQSARLAALFDAVVAIVPGPVLHGALLEAELLDELTLAPRPDDGAAPRLTAESEPGRSASGFVAETARLGLRQPRWEELTLFDRWAHEPLLDQMVGSELLYRCRHLGPYHPRFVAEVLADATSLTLLVQPRDSGCPPVGFVRLYNIRLLEQLAFLETAVADPRSLRRGWGVEASRLLLAYAADVLDIRRVESKVYAYNVLSVNALRRNGFCQEGVLRQAKTYGGARWDILVFAILGDEMERQRQQEQFPYMGLWR